MAGANHRFSKLISVAVLLLCGRVLGAANADAEEFIDKMLRAVQARRVECSAEVLLNTKARDMQAVCAVFEGSFESFEARWAQSLRPDTVRAAPDPPERARPLTGWELNEGTHERIYAVGRAAVGVRFTEGRLLLAYR